MKNSKLNKVVAVAATAPSNEIDLSTITLPLGRPVNPNSERQKRLAGFAEKAKTGELHRGRPTNPNSARQQKIAGFEVKIAEGKEVKRGRPMDETSVRQQTLAKRNARLDQIKAEMAAKAEVAA